MKPLTPQQLRDATVRDYARNVRRAGGVPDMRAIERLALADLALVDAHERERKRAPAPAKKIEQPKKRSNELEEHCQEHGIRTAVRECTPEKPRSVLDMNAQAVSERWGYAMGRINRILEPRGNIKAAANKGMDAVVQEAAYPKLAAKFLNLWTWFLMRHTRSKWNPFYGMSQQDAARMFMRGVENICDESTGVLGSWYTK